jgi:hypothetical protein
VFPLLPKANQTKTQNKRKLSVISSSTAQAFMSSTKEKRKKTNLQRLITAHSSIPSLINTIGNLEQSRRQIEISKQGTENQNKTKKKQQNLALDDLEKL